jgi:hypothetical protein
VTGCEDGCLHIYALHNDLGNEAASLSAHNNIV